MARPVLDAIESGLQSWDGTVQANFEALTQAPSPLFQLDSAKDESDLATDFPANLYDRCWAFCNHSVLGWAPAYSNGVDWVFLPRSGTTPVDDIADPPSASTEEVATRLNELLGELRLIGVIPS